MEIGTAKLAGMRWSLTELRQRQRLYALASPTSIDDLDKKIAGVVNKVKARPV
jgi:hypothetical protein